MRVLGTSPRERLTGVTIVVYVHVKKLVLVFIGMIIETYIFIGIFKGSMDNASCPWL